MWTDGIKKLKSHCWILKIEELLSSMVIYWHTIINLLWSGNARSYDNAAPGQRWLRLMVRPGLRFTYTLASKYITPALAWA